jgi:hypothetical protein
MVALSGGPFKPEERVCLIRRRSLPKIKHVPDEVLGDRIIALSIDKKFFEGRFGAVWPWRLLICEGHARARGQCHAETGNNPGMCPHRFWSRAVYRTGTNYTDI